MDSAGRMKQIGEAATKAARHRKFHWCRRPNGFSDMPLWGVVADNLGLPLYQVVAFVNRLEELGNASANFGDIRGSLIRFSAQEFAKALGMLAEDAARIYAELERPGIDWIAYDHISDFYDRNPDREDEGAAERKRRQRLRDTIRRQLAKLARLGKIEERERRAIEEVLGGSEAELRNLQVKLAAAELEKNLSTAGDVTRDGRDAREGQKNLSTAEPVTRDGRMSQRDIVTVTPEQSRVLTQGPVDNFGERPRGEQSGSAMSAGGEIADTGEAELWLATEGKNFVAGRLRIAPGLADTKIMRWRRELADDPVALVGVIQAAVAVTEPGHPSHFEVVVSQQIGRRKEALKGEQLPLVTVPRLSRGGEG